MRTDIFSLVERTTSKSFECILMFTATPLLLHVVDAKKNKIINYVQ